MPKMPDRLIITGCDEKTEWQLPWFLENYFKHNRIPVAIADFGMSENMLRLVRSRFATFCTLNLKPEEELKGWFLKPAAMHAAPGKSCFWIDTDCHVLGNIEGMFNYIVPNKLTMAIDRPWLKRRKEEWHNSGVVGFYQKPDILRQWATAIQENPKVGDQEVLHSILNPITKMTYINELPNIYNWLRLQVEADSEDSPNKKIMHWTGEKGNERIRGLIKISEAIRNG